MGSVPKTRPWGRRVHSWAPVLTAPSHTRSHMHPEEAGPRDPEGALLTLSHTACGSRLPGGAPACRHRASCFRLCVLKKRGQPPSPQGPHFWGAWHPRSTSGWRRKRRGISCLFLQMGNKALRLVRCPPVRWSGCRASLGWQLRSSAQCRGLSWRAGAQWWGSEWWATVVCRSVYPTYVLVSGTEDYPVHDCI